MTRVVLPRVRVSDGGSRAGPGRVDMSSGCPRAVLGTSWLSLVVTRGLPGGPERPPSRGSSQLVGFSLLARVRAHCSSCRSGAPGPLPVGAGSEGAGSGSGPGPGLGGQGPGGYTLSLVQRGTNFERSCSKWSLRAAARGGGL